MKVIRFSMIIHFLILACLTDGTFAQEYTEFNLPEDAKRRLGKGKIVDMAYSPDGTRLAVATSIGIWIYDSQTGREVDILRGHTREITGIAYAPDGRTLASSSAGEDYLILADDTLILWDTVSGTRKATLPGSGTYSIAFSPDGKTIATGGYEYVQLWDAVSGEPTASFQTESNIVIENLAFSPDGKTIATASTADIHLWNVATATHKATLQGHTNSVLSLSFSPDGSTLASGSMDYTIRLWDTTTATHKATLADPYAPQSIAFSPDGKTIAQVRYRDVLLWDVPSGEVRRTLTGHKSWIKALAFSPDGKTIATASGEIRLWDVVSGKQKKSFGNHMEPVTNVAFSPDGSTLAGCEANRIHLLDGRSGAHKILIRGHTDDVTSIAFSPDGSTLASSSWDATVRVWDVVSGAQKAIFLGHDWSVNSVAFSPDGKTLVSGGSDKTVRLWDVVGGTHTILTGHTEEVVSVAFSPDGKMIATGSRDKTVHLWDARSGQHRQTLTGPIAGIYSVAFSPDSKTLAVGTEVSEFGEMWLWDATTGEYKAVKKGFYDRVSFAFSPDGKTFATQAKRGGQVMLWDAATGGVKTTLAQQRHYLHSFAFSPDGKTLATGTGGGFIFLWKIAPDLLKPAEHTSVLLPSLPASPPRVRIVYFFPNDHTPPLNIDAELRTLIKETQHFYADQMAIHGFGRKTFLLETDSSGNAVVHHVQGSGAAEDYISGSYSVTREVEDTLDAVTHIYLVALDTSLEGALRGACGIAFYSGSSPAASAIPGSSSVTSATQMSTEGRLAIVYASGPCAGLSTTAHELGHTFGLGHDYREKDYVMNHGAKIPRLSYAAAEWLSVHPFLNASHPNSENDHTTIEILSSRASQLQFQIADTDGLHQAQLILTENVANNRCGNTESLQHFQALNGTSGITFGFASTPTNREASVRVIDMHGNIAWKDFWLEPDDSIQGTVRAPDTTVPGDVNRDGIVSILDMVIVAQHFGKNAAANPAADINGDGVISILDLIVVSQQMGKSGAAAAPTAIAMNSVEVPDPTIVQAWIEQAELEDDGSIVFRQGIAYLQELLTLLIPEETALLPNYPNPFNPETWIPYQLSEPAVVTLNIYSVNGVLVRTLALGQTPAGIYQSRSRAAYWDGKNDVGERVASGIYFYTFTAGDFAATRKLLIRK